MDNVAQSSGQPSRKPFVSAEVLKVYPNALSIDAAFLNLGNGSTPTPAVPANTTISSKPLDPSSDEEAYWVVIKGGFPGVYKGRSAANCAAWNFDDAVVKVVKAGPRRQHADRRFVEAFMKGEVEYI